MAVSRCYSALVPARVDGVTETCVCVRAPASFSLSLSVTLTFSSFLSEGKPKRLGRAARACGRNENDGLTLQLRTRRFFFRAEI